MCIEHSLAVLTTTSHDNYEPNTEFLFKLHVATFFEKNWPRKYQQWGFVSGELYKVVVTEYVFKTWVMDLATKTFYLYLLREKSKLKEKSYTI